MNIFFDVDYTILGLDNSLRPSTREVFQKMVDDGNHIYVWSGMGKRWEVIKKHKLQPLVKEVYEKPLDRFMERLPEMGIPMVPDFVIDDYPEIVATFGGVWVPAYFFKQSRDDQMERVYAIFSEYASTGHSQDRQYRAKGSKVPLF